MSIVTSSNHHISALPGLSAVKPHSCAAVAVLLNGFIADRRQRSLGSVRDHVIGGIVSADVEQFEVSEARHC